MTRAPAACEMKFSPPYPAIPSTSASAARSRLAAPFPAIAINLTIDGSGQSITIDGANSFSIFNAQTGVTLNLEFLTLAHGSADEGGAIFNPGTTTVTNCTFSGNTAIAGGAIFTDGAMMITNSTSRATKPLAVALLNLITRQT